MTEDEIYEAVRFRRWKAFSVEQLLAIAAGLGGITECYSEGNPNEDLVPKVYKPMMDEIAIELAIREGRIADPYAYPAD